MSTEFTPGQRYWLASGHAVEYIGALADGRHVAHRILTVHRGSMTFDGYDEQDEEALGEAVTVAATDLFTKPPTDLRAAEIVAIEEKIATKRAELEAIRGEIRAVTQERTDLVKRLSDVPALRHLDDIIAGRFTHVAFESHGYAVQTAEQAMKASSRDDDYQWRKQPWKLLTLFGKTGGDLQWRINDWKDGSGSYRDVRLFTSEEEAVAYAIEKTSAKFDGVRADIAAGKHPWNVDALLKDARSLGIRPPADIAEWQNANARSALALSIQKKREEIAQAEAAIAKLAEVA